MLLCAYLPTRGAWLEPEIQVTITRPLFGLLLVSVKSLQGVYKMSRQISAVLDLCCIVTRRFVESVGGVFVPLVSLAIAVVEHVKDELEVILCLLQATL